jgi:hypothetical protein
MNKLLVLLVLGLTPPPVAPHFFQGGLAQGVYNSAPLSLASGQAAPLQVSVTGGLKVDGSGTPLAVSGTVISQSNGMTPTVPPSTLATGTDWTSSGSPALPTHISAIWVATAGTIYLDCGAVTNIAVGPVQTGWLPWPPNMTITRIRGTSTATVSFVVN